MTHTYFAFIVHPHSGDVLTHHSKRLPTIVHGENTTDLNRLCANMEELIHGVCRLFLMRTECEILVQQSSIKENAFAEYVTKLLIFEVVSGQLFTTPKDFVWISRMQLSQIVIEPTLSPIVQFIEAYKITGLLVNESRLYPFSRPGWFRNATGWILNVAAKQKLNIDYIEQVSSKAEGCVLRGVNTNGTVVYFKHIGPLADNDEIQASLLLSETMPQYFMRPIDINIEKNWILMHNQGKSLPEDGCSVSRSADLFRRVLLHWGGIQKQSIPLVKTLVDAGMTVTDGAKLQKRLFEIITDAEWCSVLSEVIAEEENSGYLDESRFKDLLMTCTTHLCDQVSEYNVPLTIVHGDLSPVNVTVKSNGQISFIDYGSTCISFPFVDAVNFAVLCAATEDDLSVYFDMWSEYESLERLRQLYRLLRHLSTMVQPSRIFYERYITAEQSKRVSTRADLRTIIRVLLKNISTLVEQNDST